MGQVVSLKGEGGKGFADLVTNVVAMIRGPRVTGPGSRVEASILSLDPDPRLGPEALARGPRPATRDPRSNRMCARYGATHTRPFASPKRLQHAPSKHLNRSSRHTHRPDRSPRCMPGGAPGRCLACSSSRTWPVADTCRRARSSSLHGRVRRTWRPRPLLRLARRLDKGRGAGSTPRASARHSRCCSCVRRIRRPGPIPWCRR